ncbi:MAG: Smr/MutS family protein [Bauldia litoralis]
MSRRPKPPADQRPDRPDDDARLWAELARSVTPLKKDGGRAPAKPASASPAADRTGTTARKSASVEPQPKARLDPPVIGGNRAAETPVTVFSPSAAGLHHGDSPGVDKRTATRFRRGLMPIEATLDLHGYTRESGRSALTSFLEGQQAGGRRCVLVITGKGLKGESWAPGVLREAVPGWLNAPPLRGIVLSFSFAQPQHGGSGALYVLLKRRRDKA